MNFSFHNSKTRSLEIKDLPRLEELSTENASGIVAGTQIGVNATASATGDNPTATTYTKTKLKPIANGRGMLGIARGSALAIGDNLIADTFYTAEGFDKVIARGRNKTGKNSASSKTIVIGIDRP